MTEVTTDTTDTIDRNDRPVAVGCIGNGAGKRVESGEGACPSPDYRNKLFVPTQHPIARVIGNYAAARSVVSNMRTTGR